MKRGVRRPGHAWRKKTSLTLNEVFDQVPELLDLEACRAAWEARNPQGLWWGIVHCSVAGGLPKWLAGALLTMLKLRPVQRRYWARYQKDSTDLCRSVSVLGFRKRGLTWEAASEAAAKDLASTPARGSRDAIVKSYKRVARRLPVVPGRYALRPLPPEK